MMAQDINVLKYKYKIHFKPHFTEPSAAKGFEDVVVMSKNGDRFSMNICVLSSLSKMCFDMFRDLCTDDELYVQTELSDLELYKVVTFAKSGIFYGYQNVQDLLQDEDTVRLFQSFGVNLSELDLSKGGAKMCTVRFPFQPSMKEVHVPVMNAPPLAEEVDYKSEVVDNSSLERGTDLMGMENNGPDSGMKFELKMEEPEEPSDFPVTHSIFNSLDSVPDDPLCPKVARPKALGKRKTESSEDEWLPDAPEEMEGPSMKKNRKKKACPDKDGNVPSGKSKLGKPKRKKDGHFYFPQDESLRDTSKRFQCTLCVRSFSEGRELEQHTFRHGAKSERDRWFCPFCQKYMAFEKQPELKAHIKAVHENDTIACPHCDKVYGIRQRNGLALHISQAHKSESKVVTCVSCGNEFKDKLAVKDHAKRMGPLHDAKCRICDNFEAKTWDENKDHYDQYHDGNIQVKCGYCPAFFANKPLRLKHLMECSADIPASVKPGNKASRQVRQVCPYCAKELSADHIQDHINQFHGTHSIPCKEPGCSFIIKHPDAVKQHMKTHQKFNCELCGWVGKQKHQIRHMQTKHMDPSKWRFVCEFCNKRFYSKINLKDHINTHTGEKPNKCPVCHQGFASNATMKGHVRTVHKGIKRNSK